MKELLLANNRLHIWRQPLLLEGDFNYSNLNTALPKFHLHVSCPRGAWTIPFLSHTYHSLTTTLLFIQSILQHWLEHMDTDVKSTPSPIVTLMSKCCPSTSVQHSTPTFPPNLVALASTTPSASWRWTPQPTDPGLLG